MASVFFTSDTHFRDPRVLRIDRRPFGTIDDHDASLVSRWNDVVSPDDEVWHLGDFARGTTEQVEALLDLLNGRKHLIIGNNDPETTLVARGWSSVQHYAELLLNSGLLVLCHYPFRTWNKMGRKAINLHGHSHGRLSPMTRQYDVGVDPQGLVPRGLDEIILRRPKPHG